MTPQWANFFTPLQYHEFIHETDLYFKIRQVHYSIEGGAILRLDSKEYGVEKMGLINLAQLCRYKPREQWAQIIQSHFEGLRAAARFESEFSKKAHDFSVVKEHLAVRLYPHEYVTSIKDGLTLGKQVAEGVYGMLVFDFSHSVVNVRPEQTIQWPVTYEDLFEMGLQNVREKYSCNLSEQDLDGLKLLVAVEDHYYAPSILLGLADSLASQCRNGILVGLPNRHVVLIHTIENLKVFEAINRLVPAIDGMYRDGPGSISDKLYWYKNDKLVTLPYTMDSENIQFNPPRQFIEMIAGLRD